MAISTGKSELYDPWVRLDAHKSSYVMGVTAQGYLLHLYYGKKLSDTDMPGVLRKENFAWYPQKPGETLLDKLPLEYSASGMADLRPPALSVEWADGDNIADLRYEKLQIIAGKPMLEGLPSTYVEDDEEAHTLKIVLRDAKGLRCCLFYTAFGRYNAITRHTVLKNDSEQDIFIHRILSASIDMPHRDWKLLHLHGAWIREFTQEVLPVGYCTQSISSRKGASGHQHNPFGAIMSGACSENDGEAYGFSFVYSGNFLLETDVDSNDSLRVNMGLNERGFAWTLNPESRFVTPEVVLVYSDEGLCKMSQAYHSLYRDRLVRGYWRNMARPTLLNTWEGVYFNFNRDKLLSLAKAASETGIELFVLDDGWFGKRDDDKTSLGDWFVNEQKLGCTLRELGDDINALGMQFGIWVEPEMISPDSDLYRAHPDWALKQPDRNATLARTQLILDIAREDVQEYIISSMDALFSSAPIAYVKWDMNRNMTEVGSSGGIPAGEVPHRYMLGLYRILETLTTKHPRILFESCAGGGGRFDPGMLFYMPQGWLSDNSDAIQRLTIQYGASMVYPPSVMGCHVSAVPNHQVWRDTPLDTRWNVAMAGGGFGYELNISQLTDEEKSMVKKQIAEYKNQRDFLRECELYRIGNPSCDNTVAFIQVSPKKDRAVFTCCRKLNNSQAPQLIFTPLRGLLRDAVYKDTEDGREYTGAVLMSHGIGTLLPAHDFASVRVQLIRII
ncbi:MAG: alpha-galactosidase [Oscillospiraceae bacterium]|nr:alpha-galactosidase [Oscillospiraceae bacterium]